MKRYIIIGALLASAITHAHANLGDTRAQSAKRYGKPWSTKGDRVYYGTRAWYIDERFNSAGYAVEVSYTKKNGEISTEEARQFANVNVPESGWNPITPNGDPISSLAESGLAPMATFAGKLARFGSSRITVGSLT